MRGLRADSPWQGFSRSFPLLLSLWPQTEAGLFTRPPTPSAGLGFRFPFPSVLESWFSSPLSRPLKNLHIFLEPVNSQELGRLISHDLQAAAQVLASSVFSGTIAGLISQVFGAQSWNTESDDLMNVQASLLTMGCKDLYFF